MSLCKDRDASEFDKGRHSLAPITNEAGERVIMCMNAGCDYVQGPATVEGIAECDPDWMPQVLQQPLYPEHVEEPERDPLEKFFAEVITKPWRGGVLFNPPVGEVKGHQELHPESPSNESLFTNNKNFVEAAASKAACPDCGCLPHVERVPLGDRVNVGGVTIPVRKYACGHYTQVKIA